VGSDRGNTVVVLAIYVTRFGKIRLNAAQVIFHLSHIMVNEVYFCQNKCYGENE